MACAFLHARPFQPQSKVNSQKRLSTFGDKYTQNCTHGSKTAHGTTLEGPFAVRPDQLHTISCPFPPSAGQLDSLSFSGTVFQYTNASTLRVRQIYVASFVARNEEEVSQGEPPKEHTPNPQQQAPPSLVSHPPVLRVEV